jgi:hypothetical protein
MEVVRLVAFRRNAVNVEADKNGIDIRTEDRARLFDDFAAGCCRERLVFGFDVAAGEQPTVEAAMVDQPETVVVGGEDEAGAGDVAGGELVAGERFRRAVEEGQDQVAALERVAIEGVVKGADESGGEGNVDHQ